MKTEYIFGPLKYMIATAANITAFINAVKYKTVLAFPQAKSTYFKIVCAGLNKFISTIGITKFDAPTIRSISLDINCGILSLNTINIMEKIKNIKVEIRIPIPAKPFILQN